MRIDVKECANLLMQKDNILILTHGHPDGDTLGCGFGLCHALLALGKKAKVINADGIPKKYDYLYDDIKPIDFEEEFIVAVDVATEYLLGDLEDVYSNKIDLCIDHHGTNTDFAKKLLLVDTAAAACEIIYDVVKEMGITISQKIADCLYTGLTTDTGCFRYASTTANTYRVAGELVAAGADNGRINRIMFETKTKTYAALERAALDSMEFYCDDRVCLVTITQDMYDKTGSSDEETEAIPSLTRQIEGVEIGITLREVENNKSKASIRTFEKVNAAEFAKNFSGGGHPQASACRFDCDVQSAKAQIVAKCREILK